jgi:hypothetical protein
MENLCASLWVFSGALLDSSLVHQKEIWLVSISPPKDAAWPELEDSSTPLE